MSRPLTLSNGRMLVGINDQGLVSDLYFPYIGLENHLAGPSLIHRVGVWIDGKFSWVGDSEWIIDIKYERGTLVGFTTANNPALGVELEFNDFVDSGSTTFCRKVTIKNNNDRDCDIRLFMHQAFKISESSRGDTALFAPDQHAILDYKGHRAFAISGKHQDGSFFDQYSIGNFGIEGKSGTYADAEDGHLEGNTIEHGQVDSVIRFSVPLQQHRLRVVDYWICVADNNVSALKMSDEVAKSGIARIKKNTTNHWTNWLKPAKKHLLKLPEEYRRVAMNCLLLIKSHIDDRGAIIASSDSQMLNYARDYYSYFWPRDGAYAVWPLIRMGFTEEPEAFFEICADLLREEGFLMHKYLPDRTIGSSWHPYVHRHHKEYPIQEDETAIVIFMLNEYLAKTDNTTFVNKVYRGLVEPAADFLAEFIDEETGLPHASYDLWEERFQTTTYSTAVTYGALRAAAEIARKLGFSDDAIRWDIAADDIKEAADKKLFNKEKQYFYRGFLLSEEMLEYDDVVDVASLYGAFMFGLFDINDDRVKQAVSTLEKTLVNYSPSGGVPRYVGDRYHATTDDTLGNPWFVTTMWYVQYYLEKKDVAVPKQFIDWTISKMGQSGVLPEQIDPQTSAPLSVSPLVWSHAELLNSIIDFSDAT